MEKIIFAKDRKEIQRGVQLNDGRIIVVWGGNFNFGMNFLRYDVPFNLKSGRIYKKKNKNSTTLNEIIKSGLGKEVYPYDYYDMYVGEIKTLSKSRRKEIIETFKEQGFNITMEALDFVFSAWHDGCKVGYRDSINGYHLFAPSGDCNPFTLHITSLVDMCSDWQKTYTC